MRSFLRKYIIANGLEGPISAGDVEVPSTSTSESKAEQFYIGDDRTEHFYIGAHDFGEEYVKMADEKELLTATIDTIFSKEYKTKLEQQAAIPAASLPKKMGEDHESPAPTTPLIHPSTGVPVHSSSFAEQPLPAAGQSFSEIPAAGQDLPGSRYVLQEDCQNLVNDIGKEILDMQENLDEFQHGRKFVAENVRKELCEEKLYETTEQPVGFFTVLGLTMVCPRSVVS